MKTTLFIDTSDSQKIRVGLDIDGKRVEKVAQREANAQMVLPMVVELIKSQKLKLSDITEINVNSGPGSFTGVRLGVTIANTLATLLDIPINDLPINTLVKPQYTDTKFD